MESHFLKIILFAFFYSLFTILEKIFPLRKRVVKGASGFVSKFSSRASSNFLLIALSNVVWILLGPTITVLLYIQLQKIFGGAFEGVLSALFSTVWIQIVVFVVVMDFLIYLHHIAFHKISFLWRWHRVHHTDLDLDTSSALRFHPGEIVISAIYKSFFLFMLGPPVLAILFFEVLLNATAMFNHSNLYLPRKIEKITRWLFVTPAMHEIHHSQDQKETDSNYGFNFSFWDRLLRTYTHKAKGTLHLGLKQHPQNLSLWKLLLLPFSAYKK